VTPLSDDVLDWGTDAYPSELYVAGDRVYVAEDSPPANPWEQGRIWTFNALTGGLKLMLSPGPEVSRRSGSLDISVHAISAIQTTDGRRFVFAEEMFFGRTLLYRDF
jgi:hypothetical protein